MTNDCIFYKINRSEAKLLFHIHFHVEPRRSDGGQWFRCKTYPESTEMVDQLLEAVW